MPRPIAPIVAAAIPLLLWAPARAADPSTVRTKAGQQVRIAYYSVFHQDCTAGSAPDIRLLERPAGGAIIIRPGTLTTRRIAGCPEVSAPVKQVIYAPNPTFSGTDHVSVEVVDPAAGRTETHAFDIVVDPADKT